MGSVLSSKGDAGLVGVLHGTVSVNGDPVCVTGDLEELPGVALVGADFIGGAVGAMLCICTCKCRPLSVLSIPT